MARQINGWVDHKLAPRHSHLAKCLKEIGEEEDIRYTSQGVKAFPLDKIIYMFKCGMLSEVKKGIGDILATYSLW